MQIHRERTHHRSPSRSACLFAIVASAGMAHAAFAQDATRPGAGANVQNGGQANAERGRTMLIPTGKGAQTQFVVERPGAFESTAVQSWAAKGPFATTASAHTLFGEVVLIAESREAAREAVDSLAQQYAWLNGNMVVEAENLPGVFTIGVRSVENAARIAALLQGKAGVSDAFVHRKQPFQARGGSDPALTSQWHIENVLAPTVDHEIQAVHDSGITGAGVVVGVLEANGGNITSPYDPDDLATPGYDFSDVVHPDLFPNFAQGLSQITDPFQVDVTHETAVAGLIGAAANSTFGRGVAFGSQVAALRNGSDIENAQAWNHQLGQIDIINNSWGPSNVTFPATGPVGIFPVGEDDFEVTFPVVTQVDMSTLQELALDRGRVLGRGRKGRIYVTAAGNASHFQGFGRFLVGNAVSLPQWGLLDVTGSLTGTIDDFDDSGADNLGWRYSGLLGDRTEYWEVNSHPNVAAIAAVGEDNLRAGYSTTGTAVLAAAYSEGGELAQNFVFPGGYPFTSAGRAITTLNQISAGPDFDCAGALGALPGLTCSFNGTSAAAPIASGIFALMLEANPSLTMRDIEHIIQRTSTPINFSPIGAYWTTLVGFGNPDPDDPTGAGTQFWQANAADVLHSDEYGFGLINAEAAVDMARTWPGLPRLRILDTGAVEQSIGIPPGEFDEIGEYVGSDGLPKVLHVLVPGDVTSAARELPNGSVTGLACVRENYEIETVELSLTIEGSGAGDLLIVLESPYGTVSPLVVPRADASFFQVGGTRYAFFNTTFKSYKHWGELSGGTWNLRIQSWGSSEATPEGELPDEGDPMDPTDDEPGEEHVTLLGPLGLPGGEFFEYEEKTLVSFRLRIHGTPTGVPPTLACPPVLTACPGDLNGDGVVNFSDMQLFLNWYNNNDPLADVNGDGQVTFDDIFFFVNGIFQPGYCNDTGYPGGRPRPGTSAGDPIIRPI